jgi:hypothetical protein
MASTQKSPRSFALTPRRTRDDRETVVARGLRASRRHEQALERISGGGVLIALVADTAITRFGSRRLWARLGARAGTCRPAITAASLVAGTTARRFPMA